MSQSTPSSLSSTINTKLDYNRLASGRLPDNWRNWFPEVLGDCRAIKQTLETVAKVATADGSVLIYGESGTGKELIAAAIHRISNRSQNRFIAVNCSAIPEHLLESELFGHEKGAFTGADKKRIGLFESADGGTVFLDEIGDMPINLQAKLLRILQEQEFSPVGSHEVRSVNVRIIAATNVCLDSAVEQKKFRSDLYFRLNVFPVNLPPLRERLDDLEMLSEHFLKLSNRLHRFSEPCTINHRVLGLMRQYRWPGNIRELQNVIERMVVIRGGGVISVEHLPREILHRSELESQVNLNRSTQESIMQERKSSDIIYPANFGSISDINLAQQLVRLPEQGMDLTDYIEKLENQLILEALSRTNNNKNKAAKLLGLNRTTLVERIKKRNIAPLNAPSHEL